MPRPLLAFLLCAGCASDPGRPTTPKEHATLAALVAECPTLIECERRIDAWGTP